MNRKQKNTLLRILISAGLLVALQFVPAQGLLKFALYMIPYLIIGYDILRRAAYGIGNRQVFDENFLMAVATVGALVLGLMGSGDYLEAVAVMLFYQIGELFQSCAVDKSRRSIQQLMDIRPDYANVLRGDDLVRVDPEEVEVGTIIWVQPGEKIPIDGLVEQGDSTLDTAALTGESLPRQVKPGDSVISGCVNLTGVLQIRTTTAFEEATVSKILELVENASSRKSRSEAFITRFARVYTPAVCAAALALAVIPPALGLLIPGIPGSFGDWLYRALTFLVISCPCALVISVPLSFFAGIGGASREGVLIKGSNYLEALSRVDTVALDKTGTLTQGVFAVTEISSVIEESRLLEYAALAESASSHPIAKSIREAYGKSVDRSRVKDIREISGQGISAVVDGVQVCAGNGKLMESLGITLPAWDAAGTAVHVAVEGSYAGSLCLSDRIKPSAPRAMAELKKAGVSQIVMLTGDGDAAAKKAAAELGINRYFSRLLPGDKVDRVETLLNDGAKLAFVGDGINDAPVLSRADVGIAMGALGSDAAIEAADVVLMDDDPVKIAKAIRISRKCMAIVRQNIVFSLAVKLGCLVLGALGIANMWTAIFADVGVMVIAVLNAIRALQVKNL